MTTQAYTFEGARAAETARNALNNIELPADAEEVQMDINSAAWSADTPTTVRYSGPNPEPGLRAALQDVGELESATYIRLEITSSTGSTPPETDGGIQCVPPSSDPDADRELGELSTGTNTAVLLQELAERDRYVTANTLREESSVKSGSVGPSLSTLWERRLVERQKTEDPTREYEYQLSAYGRVELTRLEGME